MRKIITLCAFLCAAAIPLLAQANEKQLVKDAFNNYKSTILNDKGSEAVKFVDSRTVRYYTEVLDRVRNADSLAVESLSVFDKLMVFSIRHQASKEDIRGFTGNLTFGLRHR